MFQQDLERVQERQLASQGYCPEARIVSSQEDLADWFKSLAVAAGVNSKRVQDAETTQQ